MTLNIRIPENINDTKPKISVIGIGGAGGNAVNTMINEKIENIDFIVANTDGQALSRSLTSRQIQLGKNITLGLGAGSDAETGKKAAEESIEEVIAELSDVNMIFITIHTTVLLECLTTTTTTIILFDIHTHTRAHILQVTRIYARYVAPKSTFY